MIDDAIVPENIGALGAIYFAAMLDEMKAFEVADRLLELYLNGSLPVSRSGAGDSLPTYWKDASARMSSAERRRLYAQALGRPGGNGGSGRNRDFDDLWMRFVSSVSAFARQRAADTILSAGRLHSTTQEQIRKAARDLAVNLSLHGMGVTATVATDLREQVDELMKGLADADIQRAYGVRDVWQLIERVSSLELGGSRTSARYRAMAESGAVVFAWLVSRAPRLLQAAADALDPADIGNTRRSDRPTTSPTDYDLVNACEQWLAAASVDDSHVETSAQPVETSGVRDAVELLLSKSPAFTHLSPAMRARVARDTASIADYLLETAGPFASLTEKVNFPTFVAGLIEGVFHAIVDASIRQMEAYADLVAAVAASLREFGDEHIGDLELRERLCERFPELCEPADSADGAARRLDGLPAGVWRAVATTRQQLLATMVTTGLNRIVASKS